MTKLDPRTNAYRSDLAASSLKQLVRAPKYVDGEVRQAVAPQVPLRVGPHFDAPLATEALLGEIMTVFDVQNGWGWVQLHNDGYVGYAPLDGLSTNVEEPSHKVSARLTYVYPAPDMKTPPYMRLSFGCGVSLSGLTEGRFVELARGGFVFADHLVGGRERAKDFVRVAERYVGAPYLWGGKSSTGIDCSGLVQISLQAAGALCPRDSDMQLAGVGETIDPAKLDAIQRGDLLFWQGHAAIAQSGDWMLHASGFHMEVVVEPIRRAIERIAESHGPLMAIKRPQFDAATAALPEPKPATIQKTPAGASAPLERREQDISLPQPQLAASPPAPAAFRAVEAPTPPLKAQPGPQQAMKDNKPETAPQKAEKENKPEPAPTAVERLAPASRTSGFSNFRVRSGFSRHDAPAQPLAPDNTVTAKDLPAVPEK
jgi:hypothetical protein